MSAGRRRKGAGRTAPAPGDRRSRTASRARARPALAGGRGREEVVLTVDGISSVPGDGVFLAAQMAADFGTDGQIFHFGWPSHGTQLGHVADRDAVPVARNGMQQMLQDLAAAGAREIVIVAQSVGTRRTLEVPIKMAHSGDRATLARRGGAVLMSPDIDPAPFREQARDIGDLPDPFVLLTSREDAALPLSARLTGCWDRLGHLLSSEEVGGFEVIVIDLTGAADAASRHLAAAISPPP